MIESSPLIILARHGLFLSNHTSSLVDAVKRPYSIRLANENDTKQLLVIEKTCWGPLQLPESRILSRLRNHPFGQWVCEVENVVVGVLFTQLLPSVEALLQNGIDFSNQEELNNVNNSRVIQLLGVAVLPDFAHLQIGSGLRNFVLQLAHLSSEITDVVAMTRCSVPIGSSDKSLAENKLLYNAKALAGADPTLAFHTGGGATIVTTVPDYRPEDTLNYGHSVYIRYSIRSTEKSSDSNSHMVLPVAAEGPAAVLSTADVRELLTACLDTSSARCALQALSDVALLDSPFMDLGLHSLAMIDMQAALRKLLDDRGVTATFSSTVLFDFPTPRALLGKINNERVASFEPKSVVVSDETATGGQAAFAICAMSCRLPGGINTPEEFHTALLGRTSTVSRVPDEWSWDTKTKHASFLDSDTAETFDPAFFKLNAAEAQQMDPHQRIILEVSHEALVGAQVLQQAGGSDRVGVFVGLCNNEWKYSNGTGELGPYHTTGSAQSAAANRLSFLLGLTGPSMVVDTACSSSLAALHTAMNALRCGDCDVALVAAADLLVSDYSLQVVCKYISFYYCFSYYFLNFLLLIALTH